MNKKYKKINNFLYVVSEDGKEVTIAYKAVLSNIAGQLIVSKQLNGILAPTGMYQDVEYNGFRYIGIVYHNTISEDELQVALSA